MKGQGSKDHPLDYSSLFLEIGCKAKTRIRVHLKEQSAGSARCFHPIFLVKGEGGKKGDSII